MRCCVSTYLFCHADHAAHLLAEALSSSTGFSGATTNEEPKGSPAIYKKKSAEGPWGNETPVKTCFIGHCDNAVPGWIEFCWMCLYSFGFSLAFINADSIFKRYSHQEYIKKNKCGSKHWRCLLKEVTWIYYTPSLDVWCHCYGKRHIYSSLKAWYKKSHLGMIVFQIASWKGTPSGRQNISMLFFRSLCVSDKYPWTGEQLESSHSTNQEIRSALKTTARFP